MTRRIKAIAFILSVLTVLSVVPMTASAADISDAEKGRSAAPVAALLFSRPTKNVSAIL